MTEPALPMSDPTNPAHRLAGDLRAGRIPEYAAADLHAVLAMIAATQQSPDETAAILETAHRMAHRMGATFVEDPVNIAAFRAGSEAQQSPKAQQSPISGGGAELAGWQRRMRNIMAAPNHPWFQWSSWKDCDERQRDECLSSGGLIEGFPELRTEVRPVFAAPPVPSVSGGEDQGSNRKGDLPTEQYVRPVLADSRLWAIGAWLSAALDDPNVCDDMKTDIREWFDGNLHIRPTPTEQPADGSSSNEGAA